MCSEKPAFESQGFKCEKPHEVEAKLGHMVVGENVAQTLGDILVADARAGRRFEMAFQEPFVVGHAICAAFSAKPSPAARRTGLALHIPVMRSTRDQDQRGKIADARQIEPAINFAAFEIGRLRRRTPPNAPRRENGSSASTRWLSTKLRKAASRAGMRLASAAMRQNFALVHEHVEGRVGEPDRLLVERVGVLRRSVEAQDGRRVMAGERVVDQDRQQILIVGRLRRDDDGQRIRLRRGGCFQGLVERARGPRSWPSSSNTVERRRQAVGGRSFGRLSAL